MSTNSKQTGLIETLNMSPNDYAILFSSSAPAELTMAIYTYYGAAKYDEGEATEFQRRIGLAVESFEQFAGYGTLKLRVIELAHARDSLLAHAVTESVLCKPNYCHCYPMVAFYDHELVDSYPANHFEPHHALHAAMSSWDDQYQLTKSTDPAAHTPVTVAEDIARTARLIVGGVYWERVGLWCHELIEARSRFMVFYYALERGLDPTTEWQRFVNAAGKHHFDYLDLP